MFKKFKNAKIQNKLLFSYIALIVVTMMFFFAFLGVGINNYIRKNSKYSSEQTFAQSYNFINEKINVISNTSFHISYSDRLNEILDTPRDNYPVYDQVSDLNYIKNLIAPLRGRNDISNLFLYVSGGTLYSSEGDYVCNLDDLKETNWYKSIDLQNAPQFVTYTPSPSGEDDISLVSFIHSTNNYSEISGAVQIDIKKEVVTQILKNSLLYKENISFIKSPLGVVATSLDSESFKYPLNIENNSIINISGAVYRVKSQLISGTDLELVTLTSTTAESSAITNMLIYVFAVMFIIILLSMFFAYLITKNLTKNISILSKKIKNIKNDKLELIEPNNSSDEIGEFINSYNYMTEKINTLMKENFESGKKLKETELNLLYSQINPHFLYNAFDMILCLAEENKTDTIRSAIYSLSDFYRLSLNNGSDIIQIKNEIEHVKAYVNIQNVRFDEKIKLQFEVSSEVMDFYIPKLCLQPLVENSILHGILNKDIPLGTIIIKGYIEDDNVVLSIYDDGIGMDEITVKNMFKKENSETKGGLGLINTNDRIKLYFNLKEDIEIKSEKGKFTLVTIRVPKNIHLEEK